MFSVISPFFVKYITPHVFIHSFDAFSENLQCNSHENKENALNEKVCPNFWPVLYLQYIVQRYENADGFCLLAMLATCNKEY